MADTINIDLRDLEASKKLMWEYGDSKMPFFGENSDGEHTITSIFEDHITHITYQHNGWIRTNILYYDGTMEELFDR